jgi:hypothetical protein
MTRRILPLFGTQLILWAVVAQLNHELSDWRIYFFGGALFVTFAALTQTMRIGLIVALLGGLLCDANSPPHIFGTHTLFFAAGHLTLFHLRDRVPRDDTVGRIAVALLLNLALFLAFSFTQIGHLPAPASAWPRLLMDLLCSQVFLAVIAPWFFALQARALVLARAEREDFA